MSLTNSITKLLNMEENNLIFSENFLEESIINNKRCLIFNGYLKNEFDYCPHCGCINDNTIIKKGCKISVIKINKNSELTSYLRLTKQVYKCKNCNKKITAKSNIVNYRYTISNNVKRAIFKYVKEPMSKSLIARMYNTVQNIFNSIYTNNTVYKSYLPEAICIDEFMF